MEESFVTFEEELGPRRQEAPPQKPVRQVRRPEMYAARRMNEETALPTQQVPKTVPRETSRETSYPPVRSMSLRKSLSIQNLSQMDTPWENVTLNRCLFVAISILVLTSGVQRLHEAVRNRRGAEEEEGEEVGLTVRRSALRTRGPPPEPETPLWNVLFWWLPDFGSEDDDEGGFGGGRRGRSQKSRGQTPSRGHRNRPAPEKKLTREGGGRLKDRRAKRGRDEETRAKKKGKRAKLSEEEEEEEEEEEDEEEEEVVIPQKKKKSKAGKS